MFKNDIKKWIGKSPWEQPCSVPCMIDSIYPVEKGEPVMNRWTSAGIYYNSKGNPVVVNYQLMRYYPATFSVSYKYDSKDRLVELVPAGDPPPDFSYTAPLRIKYVYLGNSQYPIRDTMFNIDGVSVSEVEDLYYDSYGRINKVVYRNNKYPWSATYESNYSYDADGNKQVSLTGNGETPATIEYGDKPSLYSLHPVWRLLHKDYIVNSVKNGAETYSNKQLPLRVNLNTFYNNQAETFYNRPFLCVENSPDDELSIISYNCSVLRNNIYNSIFHKHPRSCFSAMNVYVEYSNTFQCPKRFRCGHLQLFQIFHLAILYIERCKKASIVIADMKCRILINKAIISNFQHVE